MKQVQFNARAYPKDLKLLKQAAAESGMSLNRFLISSGKLLAVLGLHKESTELVAQVLAERLGGLLEKLDDKAGAAVRSKKAE